MGNGWFCTEGDLKDGEEGWALSVPLIPALRAAGTGAGAGGVMGLPAKHPQ